MDYLVVTDYVWKSCKEELPEKKGRYLVTYDLMGEPWVDVLNYGNIEDRPERCFHNYDSEYGDIPYDDVIAWCELPEPYKAPKEGNE